MLSNDDIFNIETLAYRIDDMPKIIAVGLETHMADGIHKLAKEIRRLQREIDGRKRTASRLSKISSRFEKEAAHLRNELNEMRNIQVKKKK
jgi:hypothetical protein